MEFWRHFVQKQYPVFLYISVTRSINQVVEIKMAAEERLKAVLKSLSDNLLVALEKVKEKEKEKDELDVCDSSVDFKLEDFWKSLGPVIFSVSKETTNVSVMFSKPPFPSVEECQGLVARLQSAVLTLLSFFCQLPRNQGHTLHKAVRRAVFLVVEGVIVFLQNISSVSSDKKLQTTGTVWEHCDAFAHLPRDNCAAVLTCLTSTMELIKDALSEIEELQASTDSGENGSSLSSKEEMMLLPCIGLIKTRSMGNSSSRNIAYEEAYSRFSELEKSSLEQCFEGISVKISDERCIVDFTLFKKHLHWLFSEEVTQRYFKEMCAVEKSLPYPDSTKDEVSREAFFISMAHSLHGSHQQIAHILLSLACVGHNPTVDHINKLLYSLVNAYATAFKKSPYESKWRIENNEESARKLVDLLCEDLGKSEDGNITCDNIEKWLCKQPLVEHLFETVCRVCFMGLSAVFGTHSHGQHQGCGPSTSKHVHSNRNVLLPCKMKAKWEEVSTILNIPQVLFLNHHLPAMCRHRWRLLFSSRVHGESFTRLIHQITHQGPTVFVVRDSDGFVFGGFASQEWSVKSHFTGDDKCFLFSLSPTLSTYDPTGYNENFMYLNIGMETLPNGLGMGGQFDYFGLWLDQEYGKGHSKAKPKCTTYGSPQLSEKQDFSVEVLEVWGVGLPPEQEAKKRSVLDTETEAKALLEIAGKEIHSEGLREPDSYSDDEDA